MTFSVLSECLSQTERRGLRGQRSIKVFEQVHWGPQSPGKNADFFKSYRTNKILRKNKLELPHFELLTGHCGRKITACNFKTKDFFSKERAAHLSLKKVDQTEYFI